MNLPQLRGLKYPDEYVIRFFYKNSLSARPGTVIELGCGNGNNLLLFNEYGWEVLGVDIDAKALDDARYNFSMQSSGTKHAFYRRDLSEGIRGLVTRRFDVILLPSVLYYIPRVCAIRLLDELREHCAPGGLVYLRSRTVRDYRFRRGPEVEHNGYRLTEAATGEEGVLNVFYDEWELVDMLRNHLSVDMSTAEVLTLEFQNLQQGVRVANSDIVIWGRIAS